MTQACVKLMRTESAQMPLKFSFIEVTFEFLLCAKSLRKQKGEGNTTWIHLPRVGLELQAHVTSSGLLYLESGVDHAYYRISP